MDNLPNKNAEGDQLIYIDHDGNLLCNECMQTEIDADRQNPDAVSGSVHWDGETYTCSDCKIAIPPVYKNKVIPYLPFRGRWTTFCEQRGAYVASSGCSKFCDSFVNLTEKNVTCNNIYKKGAS